ncbi:membrane-associated protein, putative [Bodo saltans]|uniref:Membrane-associated protein, putative n=1 Tax=Bodo saltans TaxID=75058 RepID=A0A0S4J0D2_BODSA|nr:membrane-associated protein, putative [Bodo saltans]|eukprot:CUG40123.1 membrane-associated protein, putative [Bodo saltans]
MAALLVSLPSVGVIPQDKWLEAFVPSHDITKAAQKLSVVSIDWEKLTDQRHVGITSTVLSSLFLFWVYTTYSRHSKQTQK